MISQKDIRLVLEDGSEFEGQSFGYPGSSAGEVVFSTAMTGYPESLSDPSFRGQIVVSTYPMIGNYGVIKPRYHGSILSQFESDKVQVSGLVIVDYSTYYSHWSAQKSLCQWLYEHRIPGISGIDTRHLTKLLRNKGTMLGKIIYENQSLDWYDPNADHLVDHVSCKEVTVHGSGKHRIVLIDCGVKLNIMRCLLKLDTTIIQVPWDYDFSTIAYDGIIVSNGPGNPSDCVTTIQHISDCLQQDQPLFGICLGAQLMAKACGAKTYKLPYGHRSHNQPVRQPKSQRCYITSQNHGFAIDIDSLPDGWEPFFINVNDSTCEGIRHSHKPFFSSQFHPEASGGPTDTEFLFDQFTNAIVAYKENKEYL